MFVSFRSKFNENKSSKVGHTERLLARMIDLNTLYENVDLATDSGVAAICDKIKKLDVSKSSIRFTI